MRHVDPGHGLVTPEDIGTPRKYRLVVEVHGTGVEWLFSDLPWKRYVLFRASILALFSRRTTDGPTKGEEERLKRRTSHTREKAQRGGDGGVGDGVCGSRRGREGEGRWRRRTEARKGKEGTEERREEGE